MPNSEIHISIEIKGTEPEVTKQREGGSAQGQRGADPQRAADTSPRVDRHRTGAHDGGPAPAASDAQGTAPRGASSGSAPVPFMAGHTRADPAHSAGAAPDQTPAPSHPDGPQEEVSDAR